MKKRVISAIVALAIIIPLFLLGNIAFGIGVIVIAALGYKEIFGLKDSHKPFPPYIKIMGLIALTTLILSGTLGNSANGLGHASIALTILMLTIPTIFDEKYTTKEAFYLIGFITLLGLFFNLLYYIYTIDRWLLVYLIVISTTTDMFAMFTGSLFGKHKLIPKVSPKKSVEGSVGGSIIGTILAVVYYELVITNTGNLFILIISTFILTILGQLGDLLFSKIKRENGIKDFSNIMPGHGGILDRLDSLSFVAMGYILLNFIIHLF